MIDRKSVAYPQMPDVEQFLTQRATDTANELEKVFKISEKLQIPEAHRELFSSYLSGYFAKKDVETRQRNLTDRTTLTNAGVEMMQKQLEIAKNVKDSFFMNAIHLETQLNLQPLKVRTMKDTAWLIVDGYLHSRNKHEVSSYILQILSDNHLFNSSR